jgi:hypothetical protein
VLLSAISVPVLAFFELLDSARVNALRDEANQLLLEVDEQCNEVNKLRAEADQQRRAADIEKTRTNEALACLADIAKKGRTKAQRNADRLQGYLRCNALVIDSDESRWPGAAEIVEIKDEVATFFTPCDFHSPTALESYVHCEDIEIMESPIGSLPLALKVLKRYGPDKSLGGIKHWEDRKGQSVAAPFPKGPLVFNAEFTKTGSEERRQLDLYESSDGSNSYMLVASPGESMFGSNIDISRKLMLAQIDFQAQGFQFSGGGSGGSKYELYIDMRI